MNDFRNFYQEIEGLIPKHDARDANLEILRELSQRYKGPTSMAKIMHPLIQEANKTFSNDEKYEKFWEDYVVHVFLSKIDAALLDGEVTVKEQEIIIGEMLQFGLSREKIVRTLREVVEQRGGDFELSAPSPRRESGLDNLTSVEKANTTTIIAATLGLLYVLFKVTWVPIDWLGLLLPAAAAVISIKNANQPAKRHAWSLVAILLLYFWNSALLIVLLPTFLLWHWSPSIFSKLRLKPSYVWILPIVICIGVYSASYAIKSVPRHANRQGFAQPAAPPPVQQKTPEQRGTQSPQQQTQKAPVTTSNNAANTTTPSKTVLPPMSEKPQASSTTTQQNEVTYVFNPDSSAFNLYSIEGVQGSGIVVSQGDSIIIDVSDNTTVEWCEGEDPVGPSGSSVIAMTRSNGKRFFMPHSPCGAVIGKIGQTGEWFLVGKTYRAQADRDGELFLAINDFPGGFDDNAGYFGVGITIGRRVPKTASLLTPRSNGVFAAENRSHRKSAADASVGGG